jgi:hypothetical protein
MPVYLDTRGNSVLSVAICDRCNRKFPYVDLMPDPNFPGMRVCKDDLDQFDPWRLPAIQPENITLRFPRPDVDIATGPNLLNTQGAPNTQVQYNNFLIEGVAPAAGAQGVINLQAAYQSAPSPLMPYLNSVSPSSGPQAGGTTVILSGQNFVNINTVRFGGTVATFTVDNPQQITATSPAYALTGLVDVAVVSTYGTATSHGAFTYL